MIQLRNRNSGHFLALVIYNIVYPQNVQCVKLTNEDGVFTASLLKTTCGRNRLFLHTMDIKITIYSFVSKEVVNLPRMTQNSLPWLLPHPQMSVILEAMADGGVLVGLPRSMAQKIAAYTMIVSELGHVMIRCVM